jgi:hypothetical protein
MPGHDERTKNAVIPGRVEDANPESGDESDNAEIPGSPLRAAPE